MLGEGVGAMAFECSIKGFVHIAEGDHSGSGNYFVIAIDKCIEVFPITFATVRTSGFVGKVEAVFWIDCSVHYFPLTESARKIDRFYWCVDFRMSEYL